MKKILSLFALLALFLIGGANQAVADYYVGERLTVSEVQDGDFVIFEAASSTVNYGYYIQETPDGYFWKEGLGDNCVWRLISTGDADTYYFQNVSTGNYISGNGYSVADCKTVSDQASAAKIKLNGWNSSWYKYTSYPQGWDENSIIISMVGGGNYGNRLFDDAKINGTFNRDGLHCDPYNIFKVSTSTGIPFSSMTNTTEAHNGVVVNGLTYNLSTALLTPTGQLKGNSATLTTANQNLTTESVHIPATVTYSGVKYNVTEIETEAFQHGEFSTLTFESPCNFTSIGNRTFYNCNNVKKVELPEGLTTLGAWRSFSTMASLTEIKLPKSISSIQDHSFSSNPNLRVIFFKNATPPSIGTWDVFGETTVPSQISIVVPTEAAVESYTTKLSTAYPSITFKEIVTEKTYYTNLYGAEYYKDLTTLRNAINFGIGFVSGIKDDASLAAAKALLAGTPTPEELHNAVENYVISLRDDGYYFIISQFDGFRSLGNGANAQNYDGKEAALGYSTKSGVSGSLGNMVSWVVQKREEPNAYAVWRIIKDGDNYKLKNVGSGKYAGAAADGNKIGWTNEYEIAQQITLTTEGNFTICNATPASNTNTWKIEGGFHNNSADFIEAATGVNGWGSTNGTERLWRIYELSDFQEDAIQDFLSEKLKVAVGAGVGVAMGMKDAVSQAVAETLLEGTPTCSEIENALDNVLPLTSGYYRLLFPKDNNGNSGNPYVFFGNDKKLTANLTEEEAKKDYSTVWSIDVLSDTYSYIDSKGYEITMTSQGDYRPYYNSSNSVQKEVIQDSNMKAHVIQPIGGFKDGSLGALTIDVTQSSGNYTAHFLRRRSANAIKADHVTSNPVSNGHQAFLVPATDITITMHEAEGNYWATLYVPFGVTLPEGTAAYVGNVGTDGRLKLTSLGQNIPAGTPVIVCGDAASVTATINDEIPAYEGTNGLKGQYLAHDAASDNVLTLGKKDGKVGFYTISNALGANKAYLAASTGAKGFQFVFDDDDITGINDAQTSNLESQTYFDLQGRKVAAPQKGSLYIKGGKVVKF